MSSIASLNSQGANFSVPSHVIHLSQEARPVNASYTPDNKPPIPEASKHNSKEESFFSKLGNFFFKGFLEKLTLAGIFSSLLSLNPFVSILIGTVLGVGIGHLVAIGEEKVLELMGVKKDDQKKKSFAEFVKSLLVKTPVFIAMLLFKCLLFKTENLGGIVSGRKLAEKLESFAKLCLPNFKNIENQLSLDNTLTAPERLEKIGNYASQELDKKCSNNPLFKAGRIALGLSIGLDDLAVLAFMTLPYQSWSKILKTLIPVMTISVAIDQTLEFLIMKFFSKKEQTQKVIA